MTQVSFVPGQRWVSNTESELGLGIVVEITSRRVEISFPAAGERRTYAMDNAPVSRVHYEVGQQISNEENATMTVVEVMENNGCLIYSGEDDAGQAMVIAELDLNSFVQFSKPQDRLFAGQIDKNRAFGLRYETLQHIRHQQLSPVRGLLGARVSLLPHQLYIASETASRHAPRVLLADEVGLGKTIEAGLIIHQQLITGRAKRVMIVVPDSLLHQWLVEMLRRFNLFFTILDEERCIGLEESGDDEADPFADSDDSDDASSDNEAYNPFESAQLVLCTLSFLTDNPKRHAQAVAADWDLLIVDEAHHLVWSEQAASAQYNAIEALARRAQGLLLLTATPEQLGVASHFARLRLLDPDRYYDLNRFIEEEAGHQSVNQLVQRLLADDVIAQLVEPGLVEELISYLGEAELAPLAALLVAESEPALKQELQLELKQELKPRLKLGLKSALKQELKLEQEQDEPQPEPSPEEALSTFINGLVSSLLDRHGTGRVLFRNTRASVAGFPERKLHGYPLPVPAHLEPLLADASIEQRLAPELLLGDNWIAEDPRVAWLVDWLRQYRSEKILLICARAQTALDLEVHLRLREGLSSAVFHEGLSLIARDRAAAYFADDEEGAQLLICSEIGSEGRNFQFSHHLVLFDLPLNPDLLEQRIGRLDRIGQRHTVEIHVPAYEDSAQQRLLDWYHQGINAFEKTCPAGLALYQHFQAELEHCLLQSDDVASCEQLISDTQQRSVETLLKLQQGRDRLLELNSCNHQQAEMIVESMMAEERRQQLSSYMEQVFDLFGVEQEHHSAASVILRPGDHMLNHSFPALPEEGVTATFSRELALSREDMQFLSWEHPMVIGAMDMVLSGELGNTAFCTLKLPPLKAGTLLLEAIFIVSCSAPSHLQLQRYLPLTTVRVVVDSNHTDLSRVLTPAHLDKLGKKVPRRSAQDLIRHAREQITTMIRRGEELATAQVSGIIDSSVQSMQATQSAELQRLQALAQVNNNIRQQEIDHLVDSAAQSQHYLQGAQLKLDAIRVALVVD